MFVALILLRIGRVLQHLDRAKLHRSMTLLGSVFEETHDAGSLDNAGSDLVLGRSRGLLRPG